QPTLQGPPGLARGCGRSSLRFEIEGRSWRPPFAHLLTACLPQHRLRTGGSLMRMPDPDRDVIARRAAIAADLRQIVPGEGVIYDEDERRVYETDGLTAYRELPLLTVLPSNTEQVSRVLRYCSEHKVKVVPRGAGTSLSGGALPLADGILLGLAKFNRILDVDFANRCVVAQPG